MTTGIAGVVRRLFFGLFLKFAVIIVESLFEIAFRPGDIFVDLCIGESRVVD